MLFIGFGSALLLMMVLLNLLQSSGEKLEKG